MMDPELLASLIDRHAAALVLFARQWCATPDDVVQTAFVKLSGRDSALPNHVPWLFKVVRNAAIDAGRSDRRRRKYEAAAAGQSRSWFEPGDDPAGLDAATATAALADLPGDVREVVVAHLWGGLTFIEIADAIGSSPATCHRRYTAGLDRLRELLRVPCPKTAKLPS